MFIVISWIVVPSVPRGVVRLQILSRRIQRALLMEHTTKFKSMNTMVRVPSGVGAMDTDEDGLKPVFNDPEVDDTEFYYTPSPKKEARKERSRRRSSK